MKAPKQNLPHTQMRPETFPFAVPFVRFAALCRWVPNFVWGPRRLYDHEIVYVVQGRLQVQLGERTLSVPADHALFIPPRLRQVFRAGPGPEPQEHIGIHFDWTQQADSSDFSLYDGSYGLLMEDAREQYFREPRFVPGWDFELSPVIDLRGRPRVRTLLQEVVAAHAQRGEVVMWLAGGFLSAAMAQLSYEASLLRDIAVNPHIGPDAVRRVLRARELLESVGPAPPSVAEVAAQVGWSPDHLARMCREVLDISPHRIQAEARLNRARLLLRRNMLTLAQISEECGFSDVSHFMSTFKRETGMTARQFQRMDPEEISRAMH